MEDVWISQSGDIPRWLDDADVRQGIRAMLKIDRCLEERCRLGREADNLCRWFGRELAAIELVLHEQRSTSCHFQTLSTNSQTISLDHPIAVQLQQKRDRLIHLQGRWSNPLASSLRFEFHVREAREIVQRVTGHGTQIPLYWVNPVIPTTAHSAVEMIDWIHDEPDADSHLEASHLEAETHYAVLADILAVEDDVGLSGSDVDLSSPDIHWTTPVGSLLLFVGWSSHCGTGPYHI